MPVVTLARHAMATRFEVVLHGDNTASLRAAGEAALDEIEGLAAQMSLYNPASEISRINARAAAGPVRVEPTLFRLLQRAQKLWHESDGTFDITIAPLVRCWGFMGGTGQLPAPGDIAAARAVTGMHLVTLDDSNFTIQFANPGVMLDLGSIGKGHAIEQAVDLLLEAGVESALIHGGTSSIYALGAPPGEAAWKVAIEHPASSDSSRPGALFTGGPPPTESLLSVVPLKNESLSVSAVWGKAFITNGKIHGHVLDPRSGEPVTGALLAAVALPSATETDALSTMLLALGEPGLDRLGELRPGARSLVLLPPDATGEFPVARRGLSAPNRGL
ncbi:MAG TPA: FAD:protein FMN transferase [Verrucomicrobiae bacterium]|nr:FAD:protein FMN transferase [Verrucomicrobiae bacterium]